MWGAVKNLREGDAGVLSPGCAQEEYIWLDFRSGCIGFLGVVDILSPIANISSLLFPEFGRDTRMMME